MNKTCLDDLKLMLFVLEKDKAGVDLNITTHRKPTQVYRSDTYPAGLEGCSHEGWAWHFTSLPSYMSKPPKYFLNILYLWSPHGLISYLLGWSQVNALFWWLTAQYIWRLGSQEKLQRRWRRAYLSYCQIGSCKRVCTATDRQNCQGLQQVVRRKI